MRTPRLFLALALVVVLPACGDDGGVDTSGDATDAPAVLPSLVGTWRALPSAFDAVPRPIAARNRLAYGADLSLVTTYDGQMRTYDYAVNGDFITATARDAEEPRSKGYRHHIVGGMMLDQAMTPMTPGAGLANVWFGRGTQNGAQLDMTWDLRANMTARVTLDGGTAQQVYDGTWEGRNGTDVYIVVMIDDITPMGYLGAMLDDQLGVPYELLP